jgi:dephospho-CoA kinase
MTRTRLTEETARLMMKAQPPRSRILQCADDLIVNEDDEAALRKRLDALSRIWMAITR